MTNRRQYKLNNLDCASCASKIEERLSAIDAFSEVSVSFPTATLTLTAQNSRALRQLLAALLRAAHQDRENRGVSLYADLNPY